MPDEVGILRSLGFAVFTPRVLPRGLDARSTVIEENPDRGALALPPETLAVLERHPFYERRWTPTLAAILNEHFETVVTAFYPACLASAVRCFQGRVVARTFGRVGSAGYHDLTLGWGEEGLDRDIAAMGARFVYGQGYDVLAEVEPPLYQLRAVTLPVPVPSWVMAASGQWTGANDELLFLCPVITGNPYYGALYQDIKATFGDLPHRIFGRQSGRVSDPAVIDSPDDAALLQLYAGASAFVYPSAEARHVHYSPLEAMIVGAPVLYRRGSLLDRLAGESLPGACDGLDEMRVKAAELAGGATALSAEIRAAQPAILKKFSLETAREAWGRLLCSGGLA
jgi:glycosyltransferase involved in cell wall biosynthesis